MEQISEPSGAETPKRLRKPLTPEHLEALGRARLKANAVRLANKNAKLQAKLDASLEAKMIKKIMTPVVVEPIVEPVVEPIAEPIAEPVVEPVVEPTPPLIKNKPKKPVVIIEQDSDDDDEFEPSEKVIFVKRVTRKKPTHTPTGAEPRSGSYETPTPTPPELVRQTNKQTHIEQAYNNMLTGVFSHSSRRR